MQIKEKLEMYDIDKLFDDNNEKSLIEIVAIIFIGIMYILIHFVVIALLLITAPIWIVPYLIYKAMKGKQIEREE